MLDAFILSPRSHSKLMFALFQHPISFEPFDIEIHERLAVTEKFVTRECGKKKKTPHE